jgi:Fe-S oxidoreductase
MHCHANAVDPRAATVKMRGSEHERSFGKQGNQASMSSQPEKHQTQPQTQPRKQPRVGLFATCLVDLIRPSVGFAAVKLLEDAGCIVEVPGADLLRPARLQFRRPATTRAMAAR